MDLKLISKNNMGAAATLFLVILLSQSRFFNFLFDTALGRSILLLFILGISYANKILGIVAVLFIIIMFNQSDIGYLEGFTSTPSSTSSSSLDSTKPPQFAQDRAKLKEQKMNTVSQQIATTTSSTVSSTPTTTNNNTNTNTTTTSETFAGREGFNMIDREGTMLKGKRSNEIPVFTNSRSQNEDVEPSDKSVFTSDYSQF